MRFQGKVAIVTGGTRGIGRAIALQLAREGCDLLVTYRSDSAAAETTRQEIEATGRRVLALRSDAADSAAAARVVSEARQSLGGLHIVVNNAGVARDRALYAMSEEEWDLVVDTSLKGAFNLCRAAVTSLVKQRYGRILNVSSVSALRGLPGQAGYAAAKAGLLGFTRALARELGRFQITVNAIAPGYVEGEMVGALSPRQQEAALELIPFRRFGSPAEVAGLACFLLSDEATYITGQAVVIDGGLTA